MDSPCTQIDGGGQTLEGKAAIVGAHEHAIGHDDVKVDRELQRGVEPGMPERPIPDCATASPKHQGRGAGAADAEQPQARNPPEETPPRVTTPTASRLP